MPAHTSESKVFATRVQTAMSLCADLNALAFTDLAGRAEKLTEIFGGPLPDSLSILPPFYTDYGLHTTFGERVFINQGCFLLDFGRVTIGDRVLIGPRVTLSTSGHPVAPDERFDYITHAPIVIEDNVWIGAGATIAPGRHDRPRLRGRCRHSRREGRAPAERGNRCERRRAAHAPRAGSLHTAGVAPPPTLAENVCARQGPLPTGARKRCEKSGVSSAKQYPRHGEHRNDLGD
ncbi:hypothetical protein [Gordonia zhenghanii]|uniref:hypothetical protein n=1 Tax=Gordonia zhenghanii TaxID=2911516 RepID=UPI001F19C52F|nr:hypothetical protein [Gordonia zhenghanii]